MKMKAFELKQYRSREVIRHASNIIETSYKVLHKRKIGLSNYDYVMNLDSVLAKLKELEPILVEAELNTTAEIIRETIKALKEV